MAKKKIETVKRFGTRYGRTLRERLAKVESQQKKSHRCPYCNYERAKQQSTGIFLCTKCGAKFASKAYTVSKVNTIKTDVELE